ncbi:type II secretion system protein [Sulfuriroseicoccus oceanibius]|uniref:Type II secretion system protein n=1 Tax=Sulfuriroseicoccus oceanibius TaxID=2707525 RepID=A0A6B3LDU7_9BACT|nr:type II secretion system protein [Sulfuriroseicoccus oceanibius]QQL45238.1 type II secretion system protein [Sulfuriroseicoccus oceanibius]
MKSQRQHSISGGFTIVEMMVSLVIVGVLVLITLTALHRAKEQAIRTSSANNLRILGVAVADYLGEHNSRFFPYRSNSQKGGVQWWFGREPKGSGGEGSRDIHTDEGPLGKYIKAAGGVDLCPGMGKYMDLRKAKFKGASFGYGYNVHIGGGWSGRGPRLNLAKTKFGSGEIAVFATCAQVNTFQGAATPENPMVEEFYGFDKSDKTIHFRFNRKALVLFANGSVQMVDPEEGTMDDTLESADVGRFSPVGSTKWLGIVR